MTKQEAIDFFSEKKINNQLSKSEIKERLQTKHNFSKQETVEVLRAISNREMDEMENQESIVARLSNHIYFSYFFIAFGVLAIVVSIYFMRTKDAQGPFRFFPWFILVGAIFIIVRHTSRVFKK